MTPSMSTNRSGRRAISITSAFLFRMNNRDTIIRHLSLLLVILAFTNSACSSQAQDVDNSVRSHLRGTITVSAEIDTIANYSGFEVIVGAEGIDGLDTLAFATTDRSGQFETDIEAPNRGLYPILIARDGSILRVGQLVVGEGDSASFAVQLPADNRPWRIRSNENSAWAAFENTRTLHNQQLIEMIQQGQAADDALGRQVMQASMILWSLRDNYPGTVGADFASAESITMLESWDDSLLVARAEMIEPDNPAYMEVVRAARRAESRLRGQQSAVHLLQSYQLRAEDRDVHAAIQSEIVMAYIDSLDERNARLAARNLQQSYPRTRWAAWADQMLYEIDNLLPGKPAPAIDLPDREGAMVSLGDLRGQYVLLEFYVPESVEFRRQLPVREALIEAAGDSLTAITISLQPDPVMLEALFEDRELTGRHIVLEEGAEADLVRDYSVTSIPTRYLIDDQGRIVAKYVGESLYALQQDLAEVLWNEEAAPAASANP